jgi:hypothetical protein
MQLPRAEALARAAGSDHGILATLHRDRGVDAVPACFVIEGDLVAIPIERVKAKRSADLQRARNLRQDPRAVLLCEHWDGDDWSRLWWVRLNLRSSADESDSRERLEALLRRKYPEYEDAPFDAILTLRIVDVSGWSADSSVDVKSDESAPGR